MSTFQIPCRFDQQLVLTPCGSAVMGDPTIVIVFVTVTEDPQNGKTAVVSWSGCTRAYLTFDPTGRQVISYTMAVQDHESQRSVENILARI